MDKEKENYLPEKNSSVNMVISLPSPADLSSALENSKAQPCNELNPLPANRKKKKKKKKRKIQVTSTAEGDTGAEVPCSVLQANELDVNITCPSGNSRQSLEHEKIRPIVETDCLTKRQKRNKERKKLRWMKKKKAKAKENVSGRSDTLAEIPNNISQVTESDENIRKGFASTCGKQSDMEKNMCLLEKDVHGKAHTEETSFRSEEAHMSHLSDSKTEQVEERIQATSAQASMGIFDFFLSLSRI
ncbi:hypothetical protein EUGRSUZ_B00611 [Eucalyptus grandis]|uniref:Uncharacterized protein n=2 Tax=Eucalyptus grandis TaxID=71139 RepID=A0ACC3LND0_EUCGR|nr:hypothetical protein EUGRSUZ_B00611 [Eucalyptus grandis]